MRGVLFDLPHAIGGAQEHLETAGIIERCETITGDFFESIPVRADGYLLKSVIHDWNDEQSLRILKNCGETMLGGDKLLLVEQIMPLQMESSLLHQDLARRDLSMLIGPGGRERTANEFQNLLRSGGFRLERIVPAALNFSIIEAVLV